jgi:hypothetical protein
LSALRTPDDGGGVPAQATLQRLLVERFINSPPDADPGPFKVEIVTFVLMRRE